MTKIRIVNNAHKRITAQFVTKLKNGIRLLFKENVSAKMVINNGIATAYCVR